MDTEARIEMEGPTLSTARSADLSEDDLHGLRTLFHANYRDGDESYLERSCETFRFVGLAHDADLKLVGFAFGDGRSAKLPGFEEDQAVALAGIACIDSSLRRQGLFQKLARAAMLSAPMPPSDRFLFAGRMAHVITYRTLANLSPGTVVPDVSRPITAWHREVGASIAALLGSEVDPETLVTRGSGKPIGFPRVEYELTEGEAELFGDVDRNRGDALLAMCWVPTAPPGW